MLILLGQIADFIEKVPIGENYSTDLILNLLTGMGMFLICCIMFSGR